MANLVDSVVGLAQDSFTSSSTQLHPLGTRAYTTDGRRYRYAQAGAVNLVAGTLIQGAAPLANHLALAAPAVAIGDTSFTFTPGATAGAANLYAEGYLQVDVTPANAQGFNPSRVDIHVADRPHAESVQECHQDTDHHYGKGRRRGGLYHYGNGVRLAQYVGTVFSADQWYSGDYRAGYQWRHDSGISGCLDRRRAANRQSRRGHDAGRCQHEVQLRVP